MYNLFNIEYEVKGTKREIIFNFISVIYVKYQIYAILDQIDYTIIK